MMVSAAQNNLIQSYLETQYTPTAITTAVAAKALTAQRQEGASTVQLIDDAGASASDSSLAGDQLVARATGLGGQLDVTG
jgi:hypothetical protein